MKVTELLSDLILIHSQVDTKAKISQEARDLLSDMSEEAAKVLAGNDPQKQRKLITLFLGGTIAAMAKDDDKHCNNPKLYPGDNDNIAYKTIANQNLPYQIRDLMWIYEIGRLELETLSEDFSKLYTSEIAHGPLTKVTKPYFMGLKDNVEKVKKLVTFCIENKGNLEVPNLSNIQDVAPPSSPPPPERKFDPKSTVWVIERREYYLVQLRNLLSDFKKTRDSLQKRKDNPGYSAVASYIDTLYTNLNTQIEAFFENPTPEAFQKLKSDSKNAFEEVEAKPDLNTHRGWHTVPLILRAIVGIFAAIAIFPAVLVEKKSYNGFGETFFGTPNTKTFQEVAKTKSKLEQYQEEMKGHLKPKG